MIVATNAFGLGIDKPDIRVVIHADIPGSIENYLQEAGRAGRDQRHARCVLLYDPDDVERQFGLSARGRLDEREIHSVLKALRGLDRRRRADGEVVATSGEILVREEAREFERDSATDDTRVRTAVAWLEEAELLQREENDVRIFPSSLRIHSVADARAKLDDAPLARRYREQLLRITATLIHASADDGISTDELMAVTGLSPERVRNALYDLERLGIASNDTALTAFVHHGVARASTVRLEEAAALESALIELLQEEAPDADAGDPQPLHLRGAAQRIRSAGHQGALPERLRRMLRSLAADGRGEAGAGGSITISGVDREVVRITFHRPWAMIRRMAELRRTGAGQLLAHLLATLPDGARGVDLLAETTLGKLLAVINGDMLLRHATRRPERLTERSLLWMHEQEVIRLNRGLSVFRTAMTIRLGNNSRRFTKADFAALELHYDQQIMQIHVMARFAERGIESVAGALSMALDYFTLEHEEFLRRWLPEAGTGAQRQTTPRSWEAIVGSLRNPAQRELVVDDRVRTENRLVLAGPGSGKTRALVHRIAYLVRVRREDPRGIIALAYNRHAALEIRQRLSKLVGNDARGVTVLTCHALAMRIVGASFAGRQDEVGSDEFEDVLREATALLRGEGLPEDEADEYRARLLAGFAWIFIDEFQDLNTGQYRLIEALAGRSLDDANDRLTVFAVADDDQSIYGYSGARVEFIDEFEREFSATRHYLVDNYRSTKHIIAAANSVIAPARGRMKSDQPIRINRARERQPAGGPWEGRDPEAGGRVQIILVADDPRAQALAAVAELQRLARLDPDWDWSRAAIMAREWSYLDPALAACELAGIPAQLAHEDIPAPWRLRETRHLASWIEERAGEWVSHSALRERLAELPGGPWRDLLEDALDDYEAEAGGNEIVAVQAIEWLAEWLHGARRRQRGLALLTVHRAKGLEFDHVVALDGSWSRRGNSEIRSANRRVFYVAMTRARQTLTLIEMASRQPHQFLGELREMPEVHRRRAPDLAAEFPVELAQRRHRTTPKQVFLSFPGYRVSTNPLHAAIGALAPGDPLRLREAGAHWELLNEEALVVGQMAGDFKLPPGMQCVGATVFAVLRWRREDSDEEYQARLRCDEWEVVVPELILAPDR